MLVIGELAEGVKDTQITEWVQSRPLPSDQVVTFTPIPLLGNAPSDVPRDTAADRFCHLYFVDGDPVEVWDEQFAGLGRGPRGHRPGHRGVRVALHRHHRGDRHVHRSALVSR